MSKITRQDVLTVLNEPTIKQRADGIMELIGGSEWISVDDRLPDLVEHVLVTAIPPDPGVPYVTACSYLPGYGGFNHHHDPVIAWKKMPEAYNPKETQPPADTG